MATPRCVGVDDWADCVRTVFIGKRSEALIARTMKAVWKGKVLAESNDTVIVESNHYFPADSVKMEYLKKSVNTYECPWKGHAEYYNVVVDGETNEDAAFSYPEPKEAAQQIKGRFAFWRGVAVTA
jgi:uncharacterized protein (DUF427 family)